MNVGGDPTQLYVSQLFHDLLQGPGDPVLLETLTTALDNGSAARRQGVGTIARTPEFATVVVQAHQEWPPV